MSTHVRVSAHSPRLFLALFTALIPLAVPAEDTAKPPQVGQREPRAGGALLPSLSRQTVGSIKRLKSVRSWTSA
jgi:hypothetical protein